MIQLDIKSVSSHHGIPISVIQEKILIAKFIKIGGGGTCYAGVPGDVLFSCVYFLPENSEAGYTFCPKFLK